MSDTPRPIDKTPTNTKVQITGDMYSGSIEGNKPKPPDVPCPPYKKEITKPRLTITENIYFQVPKTETFAVSNSSCRYINTDEQPFQRRMKVTKDWMPLEYGWIKSCSLMVITNQADKLPYNPTQEQLSSYLANTIEIGVLIQRSEDKLTNDRRTMWSPPKQNPFIVSMFILLPGESLRCTPLEVQPFVLKSVLSDVKCMITLIPSDNTIIDNSPNTSEPEA